MSERINIDLDRVSTGDGLLVAELENGFHVFDPRSHTAADVDGGYLASRTDGSEAVYVTALNEDGSVDVINAETTAHEVTIGETDCEGTHISTRVLAEYGFKALELVN